VPRIVTQRVNSEEEIGDYLAEALAIFARFDIPEDLRQVTFTSILQLVAAKTMVQEQTIADFPFNSRG